MYCKKCGSIISDDARYCIHCGAMQEDKQRAPYQSIYQTPPNNDSGSAGWGVLGFFVPIVGLILFLIWKHEKPKSSKSAGIGALIGVIVELIPIILYICFIVILAVAAPRSADALTIVYSLL